MAPPRSGELPAFPGPPPLVTEKGCPPLGGREGSLKEEEGIVECD
jgi:hypothetical protein